MNLTTTERGTIIQFTDRYGVDCSLQKSSLATENAIWFGCDDANPRIMISGQGWVKHPMPSGYIADTRMHLTQDQMRELLPFLKHFADTGELPPNS